MRKIFIDAGCHRGESVEAFINSKYCEPDFKIHCFESDIKLHTELRGSPHIDHLYSYALSSYDGVIMFYPMSDVDKRGGSIYGNKITGDLDPKCAKRVLCIDFSKWIKDNFDKEDTIIIRMNMEGAEYPVLTKMLVDNTIEYIDLLSVDFHHSKINYPRGMHYALIKELKKRIRVRITTNSKELF